MEKGMIRNVLDNGYSVNLPFSLNDQQKETVRQIHEFMMNPSETAMTVSGWAGTGKTTLMDIVAKRYWLTHHIHFCATTHKAAAVLKEKTGKKVSTVNSLFGIMIETDLDGDTYDVKRKSRKVSDDRVSSGSVIVIDEASMLSEQNYIDVVGKAIRRKCKIIFIGDPAQLSPVNEDDISIVFRMTGIRTVSMTDVMRTENDSILNEATNVRLNGTYTYTDSGSISGSGVRYIGRTDINKITEVINNHIDGLKDDPNWFRILTYTNSDVSRLNKMIRNKLGYGNLPPQSGEPLMSYGNWGYSGMGVTGARYRIINSESYRCLGIKDEYDTDVSGMTGNHSGKLMIHIMEISVSDPLGKTDVIPYIDVKENQGNIDAVRVLAGEKIRQWEKYRNSGLRSDKMTAIEKINAIDNFLFVNDNVLGPEGNLVQAKMIDFGYAHTIHKSQGSTFRHVLINDVDVSRCTDGRVRRQLRYVGVTRASESVDIII